MEQLEQLEHFQVQESFVSLSRGNVISRFVLLSVVITQIGAIS